MITEIKSYNSQTNYGKLWCETCGKTLEKEEAEGLETLEQSAVDYLIGMAERHEHLHPKHSLVVTIYERVPTLEEINEEFGK